MASENAKEVARKVSENLRNGEKVILGEILIDSGYSESTSKSPTIVTETKSYKEEMRPIVQRMERERARLMASLETKDLDSVGYKDTVNSMDTLTKNIQLLSGKATENISIIDPERKAELDKALEDL